MKSNLNELRSTVSRLSHSNGHMSQSPRSGGTASMTPALSNTSIAGILPPDGEVRVPQSTRHSTAETTLHESGGRLCDATKRIGATLAGKEVFAQMIQSHFTLSGMPHLARTMQQELQQMGCEASYFVSTLSPIAFQAAMQVTLPLSLETARASAPTTTTTIKGTASGSGAPPGSKEEVAANRDKEAAGRSPIAFETMSPLALLMTPSHITRRCIQRLLANSGGKLLLHCPTVNALAAPSAAMNADSFSSHTSSTFGGSSVSAGGGRYGTGSMYQKILYALHQPLWSEASSDALLLRRHASSDRVLCATHNQLVEILTNVYWNPYASKPQAQVSDDESFVKAFFLVYRCWMTPHALLAKLMQRFMMPSDIVIEESYHMRGISVSLGQSHHTTTAAGGNAGGGGGGGGVAASTGPGFTYRCGVNGATLSKRTSLWLRVSQLVMTRTLTILSYWLQHHPNHFDVEMLECVMAFLEEQCYAPRMHADCPAVVMQCAEFVRTHAATALSRVRQLGSGGPLSISESSSTEAFSEPPTLLPSPYPRVLAAGGLFSSVARLRSFLVPTLATFQARLAASVTASVLSLGTSSGSTAGGATTPPGASTVAMDSSPSDAVALHGMSSTMRRASVLQFLDLGSGDVAAYLAACSHVLFRGIEVDTLIAIGLDRGEDLAGGGGLLSAAVNPKTRGQWDRPSAAQRQYEADAAVSAVPSSLFSVRIFMSHAERIAHWVATMALTAASIAVAPATSAVAATTPHSLLESVVEHCLNVASALLEADDLHSAFGVAAGLNHPAVRRLQQPMLANRSHLLPRLERLVDFFAPSSAAYQEYIASQPDESPTPIVPYLHAVVHEMRQLDVEQPSLLRVDDYLSAASQSAQMRESSAIAATHGSASTALVAPPPQLATYSQCAIHWRKFFCLAGMAEECRKQQEKPLPHHIPLLLESVEACLKSSSGPWAVRDPLSPPRGVADIPRSDIAAGVILETELFAKMTLLRPEDLVKLSIRAVPLRNDARQQR